MEVVIRLKALQLDENHERECKLALPSIWETYSMNTEGGSILLGIKEHRDSFTIQGLSEKQIIKIRNEQFKLRYQEIFY